MSRTKLVILGVSYNHSDNGSCILVLSEVHGERKIPVVITTNDAIILTELLEAIDDNVPILNVYTTFTEALSMFNADVREVVITDFSEGIFKSLLVVGNYIEDYTVNSKLGDALILATLNKIPIYANVDVLDRTGILMSNEGNITMEEDKVNRRERGPYLPQQDLEQQLADAITAEDFEKAAQIRDQINNM